MEHCHGRTETPSGPRAKAIFVAILARFNLAWNIGHAPPPKKKCWIPGHCPYAHTGSVRPGLFSSIANENLRNLHHSQVPIPEKVLQKNAQGIF